MPSVLVPKNMFQPSTVPGANRSVMLTRPLSEVEFRSCVPSETGPYPGFYDPARASGDYVLFAIFTYSEQDLFFEVCNQWFAPTTQFVSMSRDIYELFEALLETPHDEGTA